MSDSAPYVEPIIFLPTEPIKLETPNDLIVSQEETIKRLDFCLPCENLTHDVIPKCSQCDCSISMLTTLNFKSCPIGKW